MEKKKGFEASPKKYWFRRSRRVLDSNEQESSSVFFFNLAKHEEQKILTNTGKTMAPMLCIRVFSKAGSRTAAA